MRNAVRLAVLLGVTGTLVAVLSPTPADDKTPVITYQDVLNLLKDRKTKEDVIIKRVEESPTQFKLGEAQLAELRRAGASNRLIQAMQKKGAVVAAGSDIGAFVIILDCSGSMKDEIQPGKTKWDAAQQAALELVESVPAGREVAFLAYGSDTSRKTKETTCEDVVVLRPLAPLDAAAKATLKTNIGGLRPYGGTPIALSLKKAGDELAKAKSLAMLVLITDGIETCDGNPVKEAANLIATHKHLEGGVDVVGFGLKPEESDAVARIAESGQGRYHDAKTVDELKKVVGRITPRLANKLDPQGKPDGMAPGQTRRWYVWHDKTGWHVRTTTRSERHKFEGTVRVGDGKITSVTPVKLESQDAWTLSRDEKELKLNLTTGGALDGFDFKVGPRAKEIEFTLKIDQKGAPAHVYIGEKAVNPGRATFTLPAHPENR